jgi:hypothetical protein
VLKIQPNDKWEIVEIINQSWSSKKRANDCANYCLLPLQPLNQTGKSSIYMMSLLVGGFNPFEQD